MSTHITIVTTTKKMTNYKRLNKLADFLDTLPNKKFDFDWVVGDYDRELQCGSVCCAMGWTPRVFPKLVEWFEHDNNAFDVRMKGVSEEGDYIVTAMVLFDISYGEADQLFTPEEPRPWMGNRALSREASAKTVANSIRKFIEWKKNK